MENKKKDKKFVSYGRQDLNCLSSPLWLGYSSTIPLSKGELSSD
jgi:hypothetical protein